MFGFGKKKAEPERPERARRSAESKERKSQSRAQLGFLVGDEGDIDDLMGNMDVGDEDLEEELAMLLEGKQPALRRPKTSPSKKPARTSGGGGSRSAGANAPKNLNINDFDNDVGDDDGDDVDLDDPDLEAELGDILGLPSAAPKGHAAEVEEDDDADSEDDSKPAPAPTMTSDQLIKLLQERLDLYTKAKAAATSAGDSSKARRFDRGLKTLQGLLSKAKAGRVVDESEIPPVVSIGVINKNTILQSNDNASQPVPDASLLNTDSPQQIDMPVDNTPSTDISIDSQTANPKLPEPLSPTPVHLPESPPKVPPRPSLSNKLPPTASPTSPALDPTPPPIQTVIDPMIENRLKEYKLVAVSLKRQGDVQGAVKYLKLSKELEGAIKSGKSVNLNDYPFLTDETPSVLEVPPNNVPEVTTGGNVPPTVEPNNSTAGAPPPSGEDLFGAPPAPRTVMEALEQRLDKYKSEVEKANSASNSSKARRMGRIVKQYEEAITSYKKGKPVPFDELPTPPGFGPIPVGGGGPAATASPAPVSVPQLRPVSESAEPVGFGEGSPEKKPKAAESPRPPGPSTGQTPPGQGSVTRSGKPTGKLTLQEKQLQIITLRQQQFKEAALNAKKRGDINQAREFLRTAKGFDNLIKVSQAGLPVDMNTLPSPPEAVARLELEEEGNFELVNASDCIMPSGNAAEIFSKLEDDLKQQLKMCMRTREHFKAIADVASANRFESMAIESKRDLDALRLSMKQNGAIPKYHYENRIFSITECNTDVREDEIEICIMQGINYKVSNPSDVDTYVKIELPYPTADEAQTQKTQVVKDTNNPTYNATYKMNINRTARNFQRFVHRHGFKCEVWSKGGFLRASTHIGTATIKLLPLETKCSLHDAFDILDGRKVVGKLEVKIKIREPVLAKQITQKKEKWLSIDRT